MKRKLIGLTLTIFILTGMNVFGQGLWCDLDFGCWITPDWKPTLPTPGKCHAVGPDLIPLYARSSWTDGRDCPINWGFQLQAFDYNTNDCYINGCHKHARVLDPSQYQNMLTSIGGIITGAEPFSNALNREDIAYFTFFLGKPEASGNLYLLIKASIPSGCIRSKILEYNPGWRFENNDPNADWIETEMALPYHINGLVELPDGDNYLRSAPLDNHVRHNQYCTREMITRLQQLAEDIRSEYSREYGWNVKISFNDLSLEYGGIFDYHNQWNCDHKLHRVGKSADLNTTACLTCDSGQQGCQNVSSSAEVKIDDKGTMKAVKDWIDDVASNKFGLTEHHKDKDDWFIHLEMQ